MKDWCFSQLNFEVAHPTPTGVQGAENLKEGTRDFLASSKKIADAASL